LIETEDSNTEVEEEEVVEEEIIELPAKLEATSEELPLLSEADMPTIDTQTQVIQISGRLGAGKTWSCVSEIFSACNNYGIKRIVANVRFVRVPEGVEFVYTTDIREVFRILDPKIPTALLMDELDKTLNSRESRTNWNLVITRLMGDARKSGIRFFIYSHQARKSSDSLVRTNNSLILYPRHFCNADGYPVYWAWNSNEQFELDFPRGEQDYHFAVRLASEYKLPEIDSAYDTFERIPMNINPGLSEAEIPQAVNDFVAFCYEKSLPLSGQKPSVVRMFLKRWNENSPKNYVPYTPKALDTMLTEVLARGLLEVKHEEEKSSESEEKVDASAPILSCRCQFVAVNRKALDEHLVSVWNFEFTTANITRKKAIQDAHPRRDGDTFEAWKARMEKV